MNSYDECKAIVALDLDPIKVKLMHKESGEGWTPARANAAEIEYRRFLYLTKAHPEEAISPSVDVDTFWHYHILDTMKYAQDCEQIFGYFLHHFPYVGMRGADDERAQHEMDQRTRALYEQAFGEPARTDKAESFCSVTAAAEGSGPAATPAAFCSVTAGAGRAFCSVTAKRGFCSVTTNKAAFCSVTAKASFCSVTAKPSFCSVTAKASFCSVTATRACCSVAAKPAFCSVTSAKDSGKSFCSVTANTSFCSVTSKPAFCSVTNQADFFSERPRFEEPALAA